jgi:hypothetical protein
MGGSTTRNTVAMLPTGTGKQRISTAVLGHEAKAEEVPAEQAVRVGLAELAEPAVQVASVELAEPAVQVASVELAVPVVQVAELELSRAERPELVLAAVQQERVRVEEELEQVAVAPKTRSVTAAHHRDPVAVIAVEDLVEAVAETTPEPAATEVVVAWVAAATVEAAAEAAVVVAVG